MTCLTSFWSIRSLSPQKRTGDTLTTDYNQLFLFPHQGVKMNCKAAICLRSGSSSASINGLCLHVTL